MATRYNSHRGLRERLWTPATVVFSDTENKHDDDVLDLISLGPLESKPVIFERYNTSGRRRASRAFLSPGIHAGAFRAGSRLYSPPIGITFRQQEGGHYQLRKISEKRFDIGNASIFYLASSGQIFVTSATSAASSCMCHGLIYEPGHTVRELAMTL